MHRSIVKFFVSSHLYNMRGPYKPLSQSWQDKEYAGVFLRVGLTMIHTTIGLLALLGIFFASLKFRSFPPHVQIALCLLVGTVLYKIFVTIITSFEGLMAQKYAVTVMPVFVLFATYACWVILENLTNQKR